MYTGEDETAAERGARINSPTLASTEADQEDSQSSDLAVSTGEIDRQRHGGRIGGPGYARWYKALSEVERQAVIMESRRKWWDERARKFRPENTYVDK